MFVSLFYFYIVFPLMTHARSTSDPYVRVFINGAEAFSTDVVHKTLTPNWEVHMYMFFKCAYTITTMS